MSQHPGHKHSIAKELLLHASLAIALRYFCTGQFRDGIGGWQEKPMGYEMIYQKRVNYSLQTKYFENK